LEEIDLLIFDLDGTLIDSTRDIANAVNYTLQQLGEPTLTEEEIRQNVGDGVLRLLKRCLLESHQDRIEEAVDLFRGRYGEHLIDDTRLYPGVSGVLEHFSAKKKTVLTNKPERYVGPILEGLGVLHQIDYIIGGDGKTVPKPSAEPVTMMLQRFGVEEGRAVMVGDSVVDIETGRLGNILTCAFTSGYRSKEELEQAGPDYMIDDMVQLKDIFC
jgi:phosphoglycolate phosphatase